jgi:hypothetical protein
MAPFPQEPNIIFDAVIVVEVPPGGGANASVTLIPGTTTALKPSAVLIEGAKITVSIPASVLPVGGPASQVAKFIPDNMLAALLPGAEAAAPTVGP